MSDNTFHIYFLEISSWEELLEGQPTLLRLMPKLGLDIETGMDLLCILGILISFCCVVFTTARDMVSFTLLWMMYLSLYQVWTTGSPVSFHNGVGWRVWSCDDVCVCVCVGWSDRVCYAKISTRFNVAFIDVPGVDALLCGVFVLMIEG